MHKPVDKSVSVVCCLSHAMLFFLFIPVYSLLFVVHGKIVCCTVRPGWKGVGGW